MKSSEYWQNRFKAIEEMNNKDAKKTVDAVTPAFDKALTQIENKINAWYQRFADNEGITLAEAKRLLNTKELKEFKWDVEEYIKYGRENAISKEWLKELENASARYHISRLEALKIHTQNAAEVAFGNELDQIDEMAARMYTNDYYHTAYEIQKGIGVGFDVGQIDQRKLNKIISKPWTADGQTFSDRIWKSKTQLVDSIHTELTQMCILGKAPDTAINVIARKMNVSKNQAGRLIMTEAAYFSSAAQKDCFNDLDVEKYEVVATLDSHTSDICQSMDGKVFDMKDFEAGVTAPPFHVWCRSCTVPYFEDNNDGSRAARDADGKTYQVPASMKYEDWKKSFVDGDMDNLEVNQTRKITAKGDQNDYSVNRKLVNSKVYHDKFEKLLSRKVVNESIYQEAMKMLEHRDGTDYEDLIGFDLSNGKVVVSNTLSTKHGKTGLTFEQYELLKSTGNAVLLHNHPNSSRPSFADIKALFKNDFVNASIIVGHNGSVHMISNPNRSVDIDKVWEEGYNYYLKKYQNKSIAEHKVLDLLYRSEIFIYESR